MARNGRAGQALAISAISAFTASIVSVLLLFTLAQFFADIAGGFGPVELMAIMLPRYATTSILSSGTVLLSMAMCAHGAHLGTVGTGIGTGHARHPFGSEAQHPGGH